MRLSVVIITLNEETRIRGAIESARAVADEILICDGGSTDGTVSVARESGARVVLHPFRGYSTQRNHAASQASSSWILAMDADERLSPVLRAEIEALTDAEPEVAAFTMPRRTRYLGRWIRHSGWYPDRKARLYHRDRARWVGEHVHEHLLIDGPSKALRGELLHLSHDSLDAHVKGIPRYARLGAEARLARGVRGRVWRLILLPPARALRAYGWRLGFLDGFPGFAIAMLGAYGVFVREGLIWERSRYAPSQPGPDAPGSTTGGR